MVTTIAGSPQDEGFDDYRLRLPVGVVISKSSGQIYIADSGNNAIRTISSDLKLETLPINDLKYPSAISIDFDGNLLIADTKNHAIKKIVIVSSKIEHSLVTQSLDLSIIIVSASLGMICIMLAFILFWHYRGKWLGLKTTSVLNRMGQETLKYDNNHSVTISPSKTVAISIPGYLQVNIDKVISFPANSKVSGMGGTASIIIAKLKDPKLIERHGVVDVAVKIFGQETSRESFMYEVMIMNSLPKSPNLIKLIGYSDYREKFAILMKSYPLNLRDLVNNGAFSNNQTNLKVSIDIANGMNLIHEKGIVHFDLKPANVLVEIHDKEVTCLICDFGFANFIADSQDKIVKGVKRPTAIGITARYAAPELFDKIYMQRLRPSDVPGNIEKKIDVYAYGITMLYLYARQTPWKDLEIEEIESLVVRGKRPEIPSKIPKNFEELIRSCWSHDPHERPSFDQILVTLKNQENDTSSVPKVQEG